MPYLESLEELDIFKVIGLIEICKVNTYYIYGYALYCKDEFYRTFEELLNKNIRIQIPNLDERYYKTINPYYPFSKKLLNFPIK
jgi:hypothetical protein